MLLTINNNAIAQFDNNTKIKIIENGEASTVHNLIVVPDNSTHFYSSPNQGEILSSSDESIDVEAILDNAMESYKSRPHITIQFEFTQTSTISIRLCNSQKEEIVPIYDGELEGNTMHSLPINTSNLSKGIYFVEIQNLNEKTVKQQKIIVTH